ncbi:MAG: twin-arginine translocation signal domain-containing protein, partial [Candidatus Binatia bacterium]
MQDGNDRRDFLKKSLFLAASAGLLTSGVLPVAALAQTIGKPMRRADRYEDTFIFERKPFKWPGNKTL